jgi:hypothetical protein
MLTVYAVSADLLNTLVYQQRRRKLDIAQPFRNMSPYPAPSQGIVAKSNDLGFFPELHSAPER